MGTVEKFEVIEEPDPVLSSQATAARKPDKAAIDILALSLRALGQRALVALADLFCLLTVGAAFWFYMSIPNPNTCQLVAEAMFALFVLAANWIVRRKA